MRPRLSKNVTRRTLVLCGLAWLLYGLGSELRATAQRQWLDPPHRLPPGHWRYGTPPVDRLETFLQEVRIRLPEGSRVTFVSRPGPRSRRFYRFAWAAYFLPGHDVVADYLPGSAASDYWLSYQVAVDRPDLELIYSVQNGRLYRKRR